jgi:hypothetical protein
MPNAVQWLVPIVRKVSSVGDPAACRACAFCADGTSAQNAHARQSNVANVPDALISFPHLRHFHLFFLPGDSALPLKLPPVLYC